VGRGKHHPTITLKGGHHAKSQGKIIVFGAKQIRRVWLDGEWLFSVVDIIGALTDSPKPRDYWYRMKRREKESSGIELSTLCRQLKLAAVDGKYYQTEVVNTESAFRVIQSIPSALKLVFETLAQFPRELAEERLEELGSSWEALRVVVLWRLRYMAMGCGYHCERRCRNTSRTNTPRSPGNEDRRPWRGGGDCL